MSDKVDGLVIYGDGSFRGRKAGWGLHGYAYTKNPLTQGIGIKQLPTTKGYQFVELPESVTVLEYIDGFGKVEVDPTNNTAELMGAIKAFEIALTYDTSTLVVLLDSEYVRKGLTVHCKTWVKNGWLKADNQPVKNQSYWKRLLELEAEWKLKGRSVTFLWVKGHSGDVGNDQADKNARSGSGGDTEECIVKSPAVKYHNPETAFNELLLKTRLVFNMGAERHVEGEGYYYYTYQLGQKQTFGNKKEDSVKVRHGKTDLLLGTRIPDATFGLIHLNEPDPYLEALMDHHERKHKKEANELVVLRLDNAYKPSVYQRINQLGEHALIPMLDNGSMVTENDDLISRTLNPPRLAREAIGQFGVMYQRLNRAPGSKGITEIEVTDLFYGEETKGKTKVNKLHKEITSQTPYLDKLVEFKGQEVRIRLVLGIDIPPRNTLARIAGVSPKVTLLVVADGPSAYSYATVFETKTGRAIYQSPYTKFILKKKI